MGHPPEDDELLARLLELLRSDPALAQRAGEAAHGLAELERALLRLAVSALRDEASTPRERAMARGLVRLLAGLDE